ncbi:MAG: MCE family protein [Deltaproteobacteria bacterium]|nr:MCE family protein [Deltaproteobacteria bacterium]
MERNLVQEIKVGITVVVVLLLIGLATFMLGGSTDLLAVRYRLNASYQDISGLRTGAVVRLAGIDVGEVTQIRFAEDPREKRVFVQFNLIDRFRSRIRKDSVASIQTEGVLGDKYISVSVGSPDQEVLVSGDWIQTNEAVDIVSYADRATEILDNTAHIARKVNNMLGQDQESVQASLSRTMATLEGLIVEVQEGSGLLHDLVYNASLSASIHRSLANLEATSETLARMTREVEEGQGLAHALIYDDQGEAFARQLNELASALHGVTQELHTEGTLAYALLYDPSNAQMVDDLRATSLALRQIAEDIHEGRGTVGLLATDPALYEDLRVLVGGAQRNKLLRAYIRRTIETAEKDQATPWEPPP